MSGESFGEEACLSVVMACFNEADTVGQVVDRVLASPYTRELIAVDDGSTDETLDVLKAISDPRVVVIEQVVNQGKGAALRRGFARARAPLVIVQDADLEYDPVDYPSLLGPLLQNKADVVYGSRFHTANPHRVLYFWHSVGNKFLTTVSNMSTNLNLTDMETCYKAFRRDVLEQIVLREDRFGFEAEVTAKVASGPWRIYEVGVSYSGRTYAQGKKIGWRDGLWALYCIARYSPLWTAQKKRRGGSARLRRDPTACREAGVTTDGGSSTAGLGSTDRQASGTGSSDGKPDRRASRSVEASRTDANRAP